MRRFAHIVAVLLAVFGLAVPIGVLVAQDERESLMDTIARAAELNEAEQRDWLTGFVEDRISSPDRQIRLSGIEGALSSQAAIRQITVADTEGIYLIVENAAIDWDQGALLFGRLEIRSLTADSITYIRNPVITEEPSAPAPEAGGFEVPELPVAVTIESLSVPQVSFGEQVFGLGSQVSLNGAISLQDGALDSNLAIARLDGPGGSLALDVGYANETREIDLSLTLTEPNDGILANLLNIEGRPDIAFGLTGAGPIDDLDVALTFDADGARVLDGTGVVDQTEAGIAISAGLGGPIATILPAPYRPFFGERTNFSADILVREEGGIALNDISVSGGQLTLTGNAATTADGFLRRLDIAADIAAQDGNRVVLPVPGANTRVERARFAVAYGLGQSQDWTGTFEASGFATPDFSAQTLAINASGVASNLDDPDARTVTFNADGALSGISTSAPGVARALGDEIGLGLAGLWRADAPITLAQFRLAGQALSLELSGTIDDAVFDGDIDIATDSLAPFSGLADRPLSGAMALLARGTIAPLSGGFDLVLDGTARDLALDSPVTDRLLAGETALSGRVARTERGLETEDFAIANDRVQITADGRYATGAADFAFNVALADLAPIDGRLSGALTATGTAQGSEGRIALNLDAAVPEGRIGERRLADARIGFEGTTADDAFAGTVSGRAFLDGFRVTLGTEIDATPDRTRLSNIAFSAPGTALSGNLTVLADGFIDGRMTLDAPNIETAAALALVDATGAVDADIVLAHADGKQSLTAEATLSEVRAPTVSIASARADIGIEDLFGVPVVRGTVEGRDIAAAGTGIDTVLLRATSTEQTTRFDGEAALTNGTDVTLAGSLAPIADGYRVALERFVLTQNGLSARLAAPAALTVSDAGVQFSGVEISAGSGRITATGSAGEALDIDLTVSALPLSIANTLAPGLGLVGTLDGTAQISGTASDPQASFSITGTGVDATVLEDLGITPFSTSARGRYGNETVMLSELTVTGAQGLRASAQGTIPLSGTGLDISVEGTAPLSLANRFVIERGARVSGTATINAQVSGRLADPRFAGTVSVTNGTYTDPTLALRLVDITGNAQLSGEAVVISSLKAGLATGGSVSASGTIGLDAPAFTSNLTLSLNDARYADGFLVVATLNGALTLSGPIGSGGRLSGRVDVARADITLPESIGGPGEVLNVDHVSPPPAVLATLARAHANQRDTDSGPARSSPLALDVVISAPNQVFLRGLGVDVEVGGELRLTGSVADVRPVGALELIRGRFAILGQRIDFTSGAVTLVGDLDPFVDLTATSQGTDITVQITVNGRASAPEITFSSQPPLPQDEVLAQLIFKRSVGELSPLQLAQLAAAAAEFAGGSNTSLLDSLRQAAGLDDLDIVTDAQGNASVRAGTYLDDNIYLGVEAGAQNRVSINIDVTDALTARGSTSADGESEVGIFYEEDY